MGRSELVCKLQAVSLLLENQQGKTREGRTLNNMSVHERANVICEAASRK